MTFDFARIDDVSVRSTAEVSELGGEPACEIRTGILTLSEVRTLFDGDVAVSHSGDAYEVSVKEEFYGSIEKVRLSIEFPGRVEEASAGGEVDGSSVLWENAVPEGDVMARGADSPGPPLALLLPAVGGVALIAVVGVIIAVLACRSRRAGAAGQVLPPGYVPPSAPVGVPAGALVGGQHGYVAQPQALAQPQPGYVAQPSAWYGPGQDVWPGQAQVVPTAQYQQYHSGQVGPGQVPPAAPSASGQQAAQGVYPSSAPSLYGRDE